MKNTFYLLEKLPVYNPMILEAGMKGMSEAKYSLKFGFYPVNDILITFKNGSMNMFYNLQREQAALRTLKMLVKKPQIAHRVHSKAINDSKKLRQLCDKISKLDLTKLSNQELLQNYEKLYQLKYLVNTARCLGWLLETRFELLSKYILQELEKQINKIKANYDAAQVFATLTQTSKITPAIEEKIDLLKMAIKVGSISNLKNNNIQKLIDTHLSKYHWISYGFEGPSLRKGELSNELEKILRSDITPENQLTFLLNTGTTLEKEKTDLINKLKLPKKLLEVIKIASDISYTKPYSKSIQFYSHYLIDKIFVELGKRFDLTIRQIRYMTHGEVKNLVLKSKVDSKELSQRYKFSVYYQNKNKLIFLTGEKAHAFLRKLVFINDDNRQKDTETIKGQIAVLGFVKGIVKIVNKSSQMNKMNQGDILVSNMTTPEIVPAMKKSAAIVTDEGGITCHAAIVSRELAIPCVIGTKIATKVLKDGDLVEVDANKGIVKKLT